MGSPAGLRHSPHPWGLRVHTACQQRKTRPRRNPPWCSAGKLQGRRELSVDDGVLQLLAVRQLQLLNALGQRGHAAQHVIQLDGPDAALWQPTQLPANLHKARAHPEWSTLNPEASLAQAERQVLIDQLASALHPT